MGKYHTSIKTSLKIPSRQAATKLQHKANISEASFQLLIVWMQIAVAQSWFILKGTYLYGMLSGS